jgi:hypothetical protein
VRIKEQIHQLLDESEIVITNETLNLSEELDVLINIWMRNQKHKVDMLITDEGGIP